MATVQLPSPERRKVIDQELLAIDARIAKAVEKHPDWSQFV